MTRTKASVAVKIGTTYSKTTVEPLNQEPTTNGGISTVTVVRKNSIDPMKIPKWQKLITNFYKSPQKNNETISQHINIRVFLDRCGLVPNVKTNVKTSVVSISSICPRNIPTWQRRITSFYIETQRTNITVTDTEQNVNREVVGHVSNNTKEKNKNKKKKSTAKGVKKPTRVLPTRKARFTGSYYPRRNLSNKNN